RAISARRFHLILAEIEARHRKGNLRLPAPGLDVTIVVLFGSCSRRNQREPLWPAKSQIEEREMISASHVCIPGATFADKLHSIPRAADYIAALPHLQAN